VAEGIIAALDVLGVCRVAAGPWAWQKAGTFDRGGGIGITRFEQVISQSGHDARCANTHR